MKQIIKIISILVCCFMVLFASTGCSNPASSSSSGGSESSGSSGVVAVYKGVMKNGIHGTGEETDLYLTYTFYGNDTWDLRLNGAMDFFGYKVPCDFIGEAGSYSGDPSKDGRLDMVKKQEADDEADKDFEFLNGIDNNLWPLKDLPEDKEATEKGLVLAE